jgi:hypothetical protein
LSPASLAAPGREDFIDWMLLLEFIEAVRLKGTPESSFDLN